MLNALALAFVDAVNVLLIGVLVALAMMLPAGRYRPIAGLLILGDWLGVLILSLVVLLAFDGLDEIVKHVVHSSVFGILLILTGLLIGFLTLKGGDSSDLINRVLEPLKAPSLLTLGIGFALGIIQSATSAPFFAGLAVLSASGMPPAERYFGLFAYATVALSLPILAAVALGLVRLFPHSWAGRMFAKARSNKDLVIKSAGWLVTVLLIAIGILRLV